MSINTLILPDPKRLAALRPIPDQTPLVSVVFILSSKLVAPD